MKTAISAVLAAVLAKSTNAELASTPRRLRNQNLSSATADAIHSDEQQAADLKRSVDFSSTPSLSFPTKRDSSGSIVNIANTVSPCPTSPTMSSKSGKSSSARMKGATPDAVIEYMEDFDHVWRPIFTEEINADNSASIEQVEEGNGPVSIIDGQTIEPYSQPYLVSIGGRFGNTGHVCGGTLITPNVVLSAALCFTHFSNDRPLDWVDFNRHNLTSNPGVVRMYLRDDGGDIVRHPSWDHSTGDNDFALVFLPDPMVDIEPVKLNNDPDIPTNATDELEIFGWGLTNVDPEVYPDVPHMANLHYVPQDTCTYSWAQNGITITSNMMCAIDNTQSTCYADEGGPIVTNTEDGPVQVGITSIPNCLNPDLPGVFARVSSAIDWIKATVCTRTGELCPRKCNSKSSKSSLFNKSKKPH